MDRLTGIVESLAATVVSHDDQIDGLIKVAQKHQEEMGEFRKQMDELRRQHAENSRLWEAYLRRLPPQ